MRQLLVVLSFHLIFLITFLDVDSPQQPTNSLLCGRVKYLSHETVIRRTHQYKRGNFPRTQASLWPTNKRTFLDFPEKEHYSAPLGLALPRPEHFLLKVERFLVSF